MALNDIKITQLPERLPVDILDADVFTLVSDGLNYKITKANMVEMFQTPLPFYQGVKAIDTTIAGTAFQEVARLTTTIQPAGTYRFEFNATATLDSTTSSMLIRHSIDGGATWTEYTLEPKDTSNTWVMSYGYPKDIVADQTFDIILEAAKEIAGDVMVVTFADIEINRKA